jgi:hypothetical protein
VPIAEGLPSLLAQPLVDVLLYVCGVEEKVLGHLLMVEVGETLELLDGQGALLFVISVREEPHRLVVLVPHDVKYPAFFRVRQVNLFSLVLVRLRRGVVQVLLLIFFLFLLLLLSLFELAEVLEPAFENEMA